MNINAKNKEGKTPLILASQQNRLEMVRLLLQDHAMINEEDRSGQTAFSYACKNANEEIIRLLNEYGTDLSNEGESWHISSSKETKQNPHLSDKSSAIDYNAILKMTPLMCAIEEGNIEKILDFLVQGSDLKAKNLLGHQALHLACLKGDIGVIKLLLSKGIDINEASKDIYRATPLLIAIRCNDEILLEFLLKSGANPNQKDPKTGDSALHVILSLLYRKNLKKILGILLVHGTNINDKNEDGETPLIRAFREKKEAMIEWLLANKASLEIADKKDRSPLWHACNNNNPMCVDQLIAHGANLLAEFQKKEMANPFELVQQKRFKNIEEKLNEALAKQKATQNSNCLVS